MHNIDTLAAHRRQILGTAARTPDFFPLNQLRPLLLHVVDPAVTSLLLERQNETLKVRWMRFEPRQIREKVDHWRREVARVQP